MSYGVWRRLASWLERSILRPKLRDYDRLGEVPLLRRSFYRHIVEVPDLVCLHIDGQKFPVENLSYGGLGIKLEGRVWLVTAEKFSATLSMFAQSCLFEFRVRYRTENELGLVFPSISPLQERFLASFLYYMDLGNLLKALPKHEVASKYQDPSWYSYSLEKRTAEVHVQLDQKAKVAAIHVIYLHALRVEGVIYSSEALRLICEPGVSPTHEERLWILARTLCILIGLRQVGHTTRLDAAIAAGASQFQQYAQSPTKTLHHEKN